MSRSPISSVSALEAVRRQLPDVFTALSAIDGQARRANATAGRARLVSGRAIIETQYATEAAEFFFQLRENALNTVETYMLGAVIEGRSFEIISSDDTDTSLVSWCVRFPG